MTDFPYIVKSVVYQCKRHGVPILSVDVPQDEEHWFYVSKDTPGVWVALVFAEQQGGTARFELHDPTAPTHYDAWCSHCSAAYRVDRDELRRYVRQTAEHDAPERLVRCKRLASLS